VVGVARAALRGARRAVFLAAFLDDRLLAFLAAVFAAPFFDPSVAMP
jgi:hypothetical protein